MKYPAPLTVHLPITAIRHHPDITCRYSRHHFENPKYVKANLPTIPQHRVHFCTYLYTTALPTPDLRIDFREQIRPLSSNRIARSITPSPSTICDNRNTRYAVLHQRKSNPVRVQTLLQLDRTTPRFRRRHPKLHFTQSTPRHPNSKRPVP